METRHYWEENGDGVKYDNYNPNGSFGRVGGDQLNFAAPSDDEADYPPGAYLKKGKQDPMSHRIIEKRRRDRMNNCLADLSRLIPPEYLKKGRGRVEKTEIIEMAIRHLKFLQERANSLYYATKSNPDLAAEKQVGEFRAGYQEAVAEAVRYLAEMHGYGPEGSLCVQLAAHLQKHCDHITKGETVPSRSKARSNPGSSSETASSSSSSHSYAVKSGVITQAPPPCQPAHPPESHEPEQLSERLPEQAHQMECDRCVYQPVPRDGCEGRATIVADGLEMYTRVPECHKASMTQLSLAEDGEVLPEEPLPLDGRRKREPTLRTVRKPEHNDDYLHSYKFKNSIERRFSRSQDSEAADKLARTAHAQNKMYSHKRRRPAKPAPSTSTSASGSTEDARDTSPQDTSSESPHHHHYDKPTPTQYVPVFALNSLGKYYVPLSVEYACLAKHLGPYDVLDARAVQLAAPLHPVTIHVNFQPCINYHVKREPAEREWRAA